MQILLNSAINPAFMAGGMALLVALLLVITQKWHGHLSMDSHEGVQKFHVHPTPRVGGIAIAAGVLFGYFFATPERQALLGPLMLAGIPAFVFGLLEDVTKRVSVRARLLATMGCGVLGWVITGYSITDANFPGLDWLLGFSVVSVLFTAFAVGGVANAINIIDGFNGLAAGTVIIILTAFGVMSTTLGDHDLAHICLILAGAMSGFLLVNWPLGKIFLGDGGAYFVGFALAWLAVLILQRHTEVSAWAPMLVCGYPILEVGFSFVRKSKREGHHPGQPDRVHLHMLLNRRVSRKFYPLAGKTLQNGMTSPFAWIFAFIPAAWAVFFYSNTAALIFGLLMFVVFYRMLYVRLTQFRWCIFFAVPASKAA
jgi:UDP-N-acetylmuramyl pentapeptide phosphotransferase/UDP-N-acetylglucosamine-1-phosphate transferase